MYKVSLVVLEHCSCCPYSAVVGKSSGHRQKKPFIVTEENPNVYGLCHTDQVLSSLMSDFSRQNS